MARWTNKYAIMRDLSMAQGIVPTSLEGTIAASDKPPALSITEETEEEYFGPCSGGDPCAAPDLGLIKHMLNMVREEDVISSEEEPDKIIQISKLNPEKEAFVPKKNVIEKIKDTNNNLKKPKKRKDRNVAVASILELISNNKQNATLKVTEKQTEKPIEPLKLLKPTDFILTEKSSSQSKVESWLESQKEMDSPDSKSSSNKKERLNEFLLETRFMFKKKNVTDKKCNTDNKVLTQHTKNSYVPSMLAEEYYKKYVERSKLKQELQEDVWTKAERQMKEIESRKKLEVSQASSVLSSVPDSSEEETKNIPGPIRLPQHRHLLTGNCVVCKMLVKNDTKIENSLDATEKSSDGTKKSSYGTEKSSDGTEKSLDATGTSLDSLV